MAIRPPALRRGDTVGVVTLGSPLAENIINQRIAYLRAIGFNVVLGKYVYAQTGFLAGTDQQRASDLMSMFQNRNVKAIIPTRGGVGVEGILAHLDYDIIKANPKVITGYSDVTVLLNVLYQFSDLITFHSLLLIDFKRETPDYNFDQFFAASSTFTSPRRINNPPGIPLVSKVKGNVTGPVVGGNIVALADTLGTYYEVDTRGKILFLEEVHEDINEVYRRINQLRVAGKFRDCIGIIMGQCTSCTPAYGVDYETLINRYVVPFNKPLITNLQSGHGTYKAAIPIGANVNLNTNNNTITILEPTVS